MQKEVINPATPLRMLMLYGSIFISILIESIILTLLWNKGIVPVWTNLPTITLEVCLTISLLVEVMLNLKQILGNIILLYLYSKAPME